MSTLPCSLSTSLGACARCASKYHAAAAPASSATSARGAAIFAFILGLARATGSRSKHSADARGDRIDYTRAPSPRERRTPPRVSLDTSGHAHAHHRQRDRVPALEGHRGFADRVLRPVADRHPPDLRRGVRLPAVADHHLRVPARQRGAHLPQHVRAVHVRGPARAGVRAEALPEPVLRQRDHGGDLAARLCGARRRCAVSDGRRLGRHLRLAARLRDVLSAADDRAADPAYPYAGVAVRHAVRRAGAVSRRVGGGSRRGALRAPGRHGRRLAADPLLARASAFPAALSATMRRRKEPTMKSAATFAVAAFACSLALAGCGEDKSTSQPAPQPPAQAAPAPAPIAAAPAPAPAPAPAEAPKPDADVALAGAVKAALEADKAVGAQTIDVTAKDGAVTLWGTVPQAERRALAVKIARGVPGVKSVQDNLQVIKGS